MSISGATIDYGPFGFLEAFHNDYTPNGSDHGARYAYGKQPSIIRWNLMKLGEALKAGDLLDDAAIQRALALYDSEFKIVYNKLWRQKLGLLTTEDLAEEEAREGQGLDTAGGYRDLAQPNIPPAIASDDVTEDEAIVLELLETMQATGNDFTQTFMVLTTMLKQGQTHTIANAEELAKHASTASMLEAEVQRRTRIHRPQLQSQQTLQLAAMIRTGPEGKAALAQMFSVDEDGIEDIVNEILGEESKLNLLSDALNMSKQAKDLGEQGVHDAAVRRWLPWLRRYEARLLALQQKQIEDTTGRSSEVIKQLRIRAMERRNPTVVLRAWMAQKAIEQADTGDFTGVRQLLNLLQRPFDRALEVKQQQKVSALKQGEEKKDGDGDEKQFLGPTPGQYRGLYCTCSS